MHEKRSINLVLYLYLLETIISNIAFVEIIFVTFVIISSKSIIDNVIYVLGHNLKHHKYRHLPVVNINYNTDSIYDVVY